MSATKAVSINTEITKLGIIAGSGTLPRDLLQRTQAQNIECYVIGFKPHTNYVTPDFWGEVGKASKIISYLKTHDIEHLVFIGGITKPNLISLRPDWVTCKFFIKTWWTSFGDNNVLSSARKHLEKMDFSLIGIHHFLPELLMPKGIIGSVSVSDTHQNDIRLGLQEALELGRQDKGQAVIVHNGTITAREDKQGTNRMIARHGQEGAILVKMCKPQQDTDLDLPTIGPKTIKLCAERNMAGIVGHTNHMLIAEHAEVIYLADKHNIFVMGHNVDI